MPILGAQGSTKGPSTAPTIGTATSPTSTTASVTFTAPGFSKLPITSYTVTSSPGGFTGTGASSPITVSGLTAGTAYTFTVTASHANGQSAASSASNSVTPAIPITVTGGTLASDATYYYRKFTSNGTLEVTGGSLTVDVLSVAGGGGGGGVMGIFRGGGGGGGGGVLLHSSQSISGTRAVTVGAGGAADLSNTTGTWTQRATAGSPSQFGNLTASVGGGFGAVSTVNVSGRAASNGGSGGGSVRGFPTPGSGTSGQGTSGGGHDQGNNAAGGGGGAANAGVEASGAVAGGAGGGGRKDAAQPGNIR
jgi:hypothetical protein